MSAAVGVSPTLRVCTAAARRALRCQRGECCWENKVPLSSGRHCCVEVQSTASCLQLVIILHLGFACL